MSTKFQKGDLIGVAKGNYINLAIFHKYGSKGNPNMVYLNKWIIDRILNDKKFYSSYICRVDTELYKSCVKVDVNSIDNNTKDIYYRTLDVLKQLEKW